MGVNLNFNYIVVGVAIDFYYIVDVNMNCYYIVGVDTRYEMSWVILARPVLLLQQNF